MSFSDDANLQAKPPGSNCIKDIHPWSILCWTPKSFFLSFIGISDCYSEYFMSQVSLIEKLFLRRSPTYLSYRSRSRFHALMLANSHAVWTSLFQLGRCDLKVFSSSGDPVRSYCHLFCPLLTSNMRLYISFLGSAVCRNFPLCRLFRLTF